MVPGAGMVVGGVIAVLIERYTNRAIAGIWTLMLSCVGVVMMLAIPSDNYAARYGGYILMYQCKSFCPKQRKLLGRPKKSGSVPFTRSATLWEIS